MSILCGLLPVASPIAYLLIACAGLVIADMLTGRVVGIAGGDTLTVLDARFEQHKRSGWSSLARPRGSQTPRHDIILHTPQAGLKVRSTQADSSQVPHVMSGGLQRRDMQGEV